MYRCYGAEYHWSALYETTAEASDLKQEQCTCGRDSEPVEFYLFDRTWTGQACRYCRSVTDFGGANDRTPEGAESPLSNEKEGRPDWLCWDANVVRTTGGEAEATRELWRALTQVISGAYCLPYDACVHECRDDTMELKRECSMNIKDLRAVIDGIQALPTDRVTPDVVVFARGWADRCRRMNLIYEHLIREIEVIQALMKESPAHTRHSEQTQWLIEVCDAYLECKEPPPPPWAPSTDKQMDRREGEYRSRRDQLLSELKTLERSPDECMTEAGLLCERLKKQHDVEFDVLRFFAR
ncbi:MAG: hypothetical protein ACPMAQ_00790 [Phycisphaerae bacterium]